jgi:tryptophan-rich hypothetical protein
MANKQKFPHLLGSKWTAKQKTWGWRHFQVIARKNEGKWVFAEIVSSCDPKVRFWLNAKQLKDRSLWEAGWKTLGEMNTVPSLEDEGWIME